jgi:NTE family protein
MTGRRVERADQTGPVSPAVPRRTRLRPAFGLVAALLLGGCASLRVPMNEPLQSAAGNAEYRLLDLARGAGTEGSLVLVALSGGGTRSAAFGFGVLRGMRDIRVRLGGIDKTLLDAMDLLAGVSGGAFPVAHFGLYGHGSFATFPEEFLYRDIEAYIWGTFLLPWNWGWIFNPLVGTNDRMAAVYDRLMFHGATFANLYRRGRPQISINATDINFGTPFGFVPQTFDAICSELGPLPIAVAVAASNGFPILFGPVTLRNYRGSHCPLPTVLPPDVSPMQSNLRARAAFEAFERYANGRQVKWIHLMDGGISDNLGLRVLINSALTIQTRIQRFAGDLLPIRRILVISVDAASAPNPNWPQQHIVSGLGQILAAATSAQIRAYNLETLIATQSIVEDFIKRLRQVRCDRGAVVFGYPCDDVSGKVLSVNLSDYPDPEARARLVAIRTGLTLPRQQVDALVAAGEAMIRRDARQIAAFLDSAASTEAVAGRR